MSREHIAQLVRRAQSRDAEAFDEIIDLFGPRLFGYFYRLRGSRDAAEDLLQELFLRVVRMIEHYQHEDRFEAWLFRIATNLIRDQVRSAKRTPAHQSIDAGPGGSASGAEWGDRLADRSSASPAASAERQEDVDRLQRALEKLPQGERQAVMLRHFSQLSFAEVAEVMCTPLGTALARVHRGLSKLRALLDPSG